MPYEEFSKWLEYFRRRPVDWRADDRVFKVLQTQGVKEKPWAIFSSLEPIYNTPREVKDTIDESSFKRSFLFQKISTSVKGDQLTL